MHIIINSKILFPIYKYCMFYLIGRAKHALNLQFLLLGNRDVMHLYCWIQHQKAKQKKMGLQISHSEPFM